MTDRALSEEAMLQALSDIRLPADAAGGALGDMAAAIAMAGIFALLIGGAIRLMSRKRTKERAPSLADILEALQDKPEAERRLALLHLLKARAPDRFEALRTGLYRRDAAGDIDELEAEVRALV
ncbi:MAG: hypothetical protein AAGC99_17090 [Pseudomonadota bacterium]